MLVAPVGMVAALFPLLVLAHRPAYRISTEPKPPPDGRQAVALAAQFQDFRKQGRGRPRRLVCDAFPFEDSGHLLAANANRTGDLASTFAYGVQGQHPRPQFRIGRAVGQILRLAELSLDGVDLIGIEGAEKGDGGP